MSNIYGKNGYINWDWIVSRTKAFCMMVGARGVGKTYGIFKYIIENHKKFVYVRRLKTQLDECMTIDGNPFKKINSDMGTNIIPKINRNGGRFVEDDVVVGYGIALSTFSTIRGVDFSDVDIIVFDEAVPMVNERALRGEFSAFLNLYETVNRNRELEGKIAVKCFLLGNANKLSNPYYIGWHFMRTALSMINGGQMFWEHQNLIMILLQNSPISKKKLDTALYQTANDSFIDMAINNVYETDPTLIRSVQKNQLKYVVSCGEIGIYKIKSSAYHYVSAMIRKNDNYYDDYGIQLKKFINDYQLMKRIYMNNGVLFESYEVELIFREYFNL